MRQAVRNTNLAVSEVLVSLRPGRLQSSRAIFDTEQLKPHLESFLNNSPESFRCRNCDPLSRSLTDGAWREGAGARGHSGGGPDDHRRLLRDAAAVAARLAHEGRRRDAAAQLPTPARKHVSAQRPGVPTDSRHGHPVGEKARRVRSRLLSEASVCLLQGGGREVLCEYQSDDYDCRENITRMNKDCEMTVVMTFFDAFGAWNGKLMRRHS